MDNVSPAAQTEAEPKQPPEAPGSKPPASPRVPAIIVGLVIAAVAALSIWYLVRPQPLLVQGEVDATRLAGAAGGGGTDRATGREGAAHVSGRVAEIPVVGGQDVSAGTVLVRIDNPETIAKREQALA